MGTRAPSGTVGAVAAGPVMIWFLRALGIRWEDLPRETAAAELCGLPTRLRWRPLILLP